ncbi:hypothetical protein FNL65_32255 [Pseudomonas aeruginosa]|uniref:hypothetical protein n=1 Tax=Pseudomonas aeruginosa TaxID=287 RepID=UPI00115F0A37|nr:hypothetical protein [Pseudomonas aeruginosa]TRL94316.1 hypothetical protein FNL65_32255 [Pseudomonas aeruginosa]
MSEVHRYSVVKMLSEAGNKISYDPHGPEVVMAKDYDALAAKLAMAEDAAAKGDAARHAAGGMEMEIQELREKVTELRKELRSRWTYASTQATNCAGCGEHKHTPLRVDWMGGYVCLTCIDKKLEELHDAQAQHSVPEISGIGRDAEHPRAVVLYLRNEPSDEDMRAIQNFLRAMPAAAPAQAQHSGPDGAPDPSNPVAARTVRARRALADVRD